MLSFSSYFLPKNPLRQDFGFSLFAVVFFSTVLVFGASDTGFSTVFAAVVFGLVVFAVDLVVLVDDFGFFVAIIPPLFDISFIIAYFFYGIMKNMAIMMNREDDKNEELTRRINADLRAKTQVAKDVDEDVDFVGDSEYVKDFKKTGSYAWVWVVIGVIILAVLIAIGVGRGV